MATDSGSKSGTTRKGSSGGTRKAGSAGSRKRTTSKPLIIDVEADAADSGGVAQPSKTGAASVKSQGGLDDQTAQAAGLSAGPAEKAESAKPGHATQTSAPSDDMAAPVMPPKPNDAGGAPSPFYLFAAGLIGALLALVLMFLATLAGLFSLSDGRVDNQAVALRALEERLRMVEAREPTSASGFDAGLLETLEADIAMLRVELETVRVGGGDAAPPDVDAAVSAALEPLAARVTAVETDLQSTLAALAVADPASPALAADLDGLVSGYNTLRSEIAELQTTVANLQADMGALASQLSDRLDGLDLLAAETGAQIGDLDEHMVALLRDIETLGLRTSALGDDVTALADAPVVQAPDRLARLGLALDGLVAARDSGADVAPALAAAQGAASFDGQLTDMLAPLSSTQVSGALSGGAILGLYEDAYEAMRAAAPGSESGGLLNALEERARQMVTIRAPEGAVLSGEASPSARLDHLGSLIAADRFEEALALATDLPAAMQQAGGSLVETLHARAALDDAIARTRQALMVQLSVSASEINSQ